MLWNSRQVIYRNINVRGDGLISLNFITMPSFLLYKHIKPAVIQVPYCKIVPRRCPSLELFCIFYLTVKNIIKFSPIFFQCTSCILNWILIVGFWFAQQSKRSPLPAANQSLSSLQNIGWNISTPKISLYSSHLHKSK